MTKVTDYIVMFDDEFVEAFSTLKEARIWVRTLSSRTIKHTPNKVTIVKKIEITEVLNEYITRQAVVLDAKDIFENMDLA